MEGAAPRDGSGRRWAWIVPWFADVVASVIGEVTGADRAAFFVVGAAAGVAWQLLFRRDLTSRLTFVAVVVTLVIVGSLVAGEDFARQDLDTGGLYAIGVLLGLIYTEHYQRWRDARATSGAEVAAER